MRSLTLLLLALAASPASAQRGTVPAGCQEDYVTCKEDCSIEYGGSSRTVKKLTQCLGICMENRSECSDRHSAIRGLPEGVVADEPRPRRIPSNKRTNREEDPFGDASPNRDTETTRKPTNRDEDPFGESRPERPPGPRGEYHADTVPAEDTRPAPEETPPPTRDTEPVPTVSRQGVYRTPQPEPKPPPAPEPSPDVDDGLEPLDAPPPAPTPTAATKPSPARPSSPPKAEPMKPEPAMASHTEEKKDPLLDEDPPPPPPKPAAAAKKPPPAPSNTSRPAIPPEPKHDISEWDPNGD
ncbi:hypothetical protein [Myxococcus stipitatus]|uniref:hypothetical protein n=1 Tax=Myxococcus stipitatus TaxID=83455 RepID=UPI0030CA5DBC